MESEIKSINPLFTNVLGPIVLMSDHPATKEEIFEAKKDQLRKLFEQRKALEKVS